MSREIHKKTWASLYEKVLNGTKTFDVRLADWQCEPGDILVLDEVDDATRQPTGRSLRKKVGFVLKTKEADFFPPTEVEEYGLQVISLLDMETSA